MKKRLIGKLFIFQFHRSDIFVIQCVSVGKEKRELSYRVATKKYKFRKS